jgi:hypothetical protein
MKFYTTVFLSAVDSADVLPALKAALAPYNMAVSDGTKGKWDWWRLYSPDGSEFVVRPEHDGDSRLVHNEAYPDGSPRTRTPLRRDGGPKGLLDLAANRAAAAMAAQTRWDAFSTLRAAHPPAESLSWLIARHRDDPDPVAAAKADHIAQPLVREIVQRAVTQTDPQFGWFFLTNDPIEHFGAERDVYVRRQSAQALATHAVITLDGTWFDEYDETPEPLALVIDNQITAIDDDAYILRVRGTNRRSPTTT